MVKTKINIDGMSCGGCANRVKENLLKLKGVKSAKVVVGEAVIEHGPEISINRLKDSIKKTGYKLI